MSRKNEAREVKLEIALPKELRDGLLQMDGKDNVF